MTQHEIVDGPSKLDLILALFDGRQDQRRAVSLKFRKKDSSHDLIIDLTVDTITRDPKIENLWIFKGYIRNSQFEARGSFSTKTRTGVLETDFLSV